MALMRPDLVSTQDLHFASGGSAEDRFLMGVLNVCLENPTFKPAVLLHTLKEMDVSLMAEIERELHQLEESLDFALELEGARTQLLGTVQQIKNSDLLEAIKEKPLSALTEQEREMLKKLGVK